MTTEYTQKQFVLQLLKSTWDVLSGMNFEEPQADELQDAIDKILVAVNDKTKNAVPPPVTMVTIDPERKARRTKKEVKPKETTKAKEPIPLKATRKRKAKVMVSEDGVEA